MNALLDPLLYSGVWVAAVAAVLTLAAGRAMGALPGGAVVALAFCGTLVVYSVDRLRDVARDRETSPRRTAFVERYRTALVALAAAAGVVSAGLAAWLGAGVVLLLAPVLGAGLLHRRLKRFAWWKPLYVSTAWVLVVVGLPAVVADGPRHVARVAGVVALTVFANVVASNVRDREAASARFGHRVPLRIAAGAGTLALVGCLLGPPPARSLAWLPAFTLLALLGFRPDERYGLLVVDGALLAGAAAALI